MDLVEQDKYLLDEITGVRKKKELSILNKGKLTKMEMDELMNEAE